MMVVKKKAPIKKKPKQPKTTRPPAKKLPAKKATTLSKRKGHGKSSKPLRSRKRELMESTGRVGQPPIEITEDDARKALILSRRGFTMLEIADMLDVSVITLKYKFMGTEEYLNTIKESMKIWDKKIERSLSERAHGYSHPEEKIFYDGKTGQVVRVQTMKHYPPDPTSMIFWLKNRQPEEWRDKRELEIPVPKGRRVVISYEGEDTAELEDDVDAGEES